MLLPLATLLQFDRPCLYVRYSILHLSYFGTSSGRVNKHKTVFHKLVKQLSYECKKKIKYTRLYCAFGWATLLKMTGIFLIGWKRTKTWTWLNKNIHVFELIFTLIKRLCLMFVGVDFCLICLSKNISFIIYKQYPV